MVQWRSSPDDALNTHANYHKGCVDGARALARCLPCGHSLSTGYAMEFAKCGAEPWTASKRRLEDLNHGASRVRLRSAMRRLLAVLVALLLSAGLVPSARGSDHLDSPATVANPQADVSDVYAWISPDGGKLNLVMTIQGHTFSNRVRYDLHVDSGNVFGKTSASALIECRFDSATSIHCEVGKADSASGDPTNPAGLEGHNHRLRVYAGLRDDPFYNNIKGLLGAYQTASDAIKSGAAVDSAGCAHFDEATAKAILARMSHTEGGPAQNLLANWTVSAIVVSVDLSVVSAGGKILAVSGTTSAGGKQLDHMARPFVANTLLGAAPFSPDEPSGVIRQRFNEALPQTSERFVADLERSLAFQDSLDGRCGNQFLAQPTEAPSRYRALAKMFADDRLWVNSASSVCTQFFAVELAKLSGDKMSSKDCGGRAPTYDTSNVWRSLVIAGGTTGVSDGLREDEHPPSATVFPFLAPPDPHGVDH